MLSEMGIKSSLRYFVFKLFNYFSNTVENYNNDNVVGKLFLFQKPFQITENDIRKNIYID